MDRRKLLGLMAVGSAIPTLAWAQTKAMSAKGAAEVKHMTDTLEAGSVSLASAKIGMQRASGMWVKKFAQYEADEQMIVAEILKGAGGVAPAATAQEIQAATAKLGKLSGSDFDAAFLQDQETGHRKLLAIQETYIASGSDMGQIGQAKLARGQIKEHLDLIATIRGQMKA